MLCLESHSKINISLALHTFETQYASVESKCGDRDDASCKIVILKNLLIDRIWTFYKIFIQFDV